jgi:hypothetical protein
MQDGALRGGFTEVKLRCVSMPLLVLVAGAVRATSVYLNFFKP